VANDRVGNKVGMQTDPAGQEACVGIGIRTSTARIVMKKKGKKAASEKHAMMMIMKSDYV